MQDRCSRCLYNQRIYIKPQGIHLYIYSDPFVICFSQCYIWKPSVEVEYLMTLLYRMYTFMLYIHSKYTRWRFFTEYTQNYVNSEYRVYSDVGEPRTWRSLSGQRKRCLLLLYYASIFVNDNTNKYIFTSFVGIFIILIKWNSIIYVDNKW